MKIISSASPGLNCLVGKAQGRDCKQIVEKEAAAPTPHELAHTAPTAQRRQPTCISRRQPRKAFTGPGVNSK